MITIYKATKDKTTAEFLTEAEALAFSDNIEVIERVLPTAEETAAIEAERKARQDTLNEITRLEATITPRRLRDAMLTQEGKDWLADVETLINNQRSKL